MKDFKKFYMEVEDMLADVSVLINVLSLYYDMFLYYQNGGGLDNSSKFSDWLYIINRYADEIQEEIGEMLKRDM